MIAPFDYLSITEVSKIKVWYHTKSNGKPFFVNIAFENKITYQEFEKIKSIIELEKAKNISLIDNQIIIFSK